MIFCISVITHKQALSVTSPVKLPHRGGERAADLGQSRRPWPLKPVSSSRPCACPLLSEATQRDSGPEIGTPAWINPTRRPVIKQPGAFRCALMGGGRGREGERQRGGEAEKGRNQMAVGLCLPAIRPRLTDLILNSSGGLADRTFCCYSVGPGSKLPPLHLCGQREGERWLVERFFIPVTFEERPTDTCNEMELMKCQRA